MANKSNTNLTPEHRGALKKFQTTSEPEISDTFRAMHKLLSEHIRRHRQELFDPVNEGKLNSKLNAQIRDLGNLVTKVSEMYLKAQKAAKDASTKLTTDQKIEAFVRFIESQGVVNRRKIARAIGPLLYDIESHGNHRSKKTTDDE